MSKAWRGGSTRAHRRARARVLAENNARNGGRCTVALPGVCTGMAEHAHHVAGRAVTGDDPRYLVATCAACNLAIGDPVAGDPPPTPRTDWAATVDDQRADLGRTDWDATRDDAAAAGPVFPDPPTPGHPPSCPVSLPGAPAAGPGRRGGG